MSDKTGVFFPILVKSSKFKSTFAKITNIPVYEVQMDIFCLFDTYLVYQR